MVLFTENRQVHEIVVYGYLRLSRTTAARKPTLADVITEYCDRHELLLGGTFIELAHGAETETPAFIGLLDALHLESVHGVVVPSPSHLGPKRLADTRERQIHALGKRVLPVRRADSPRDGS